MIGFAILAVLTFEVARVYKTYDYKSMIKVLIGPLWPLFDVVYILCMILVISIMASASGSIVEQTTGLNYWAGVVLLVAITGGLIFFGDSIIERFETWGTVVLYVGYIVFSGMVIMNGYKNIGQVLTTGDMSYTGETGILPILRTGVIHALLGRVNVELAECGKKEMNRKYQAIVTVLILVAACVMSKFGIIALIEKGYTALSYGFMLLYMLPIITVSVYKILKKDPILRTEKEPELVEI